MSLFHIFDIAGSGMSAQTTRLNTVSSNMANANNVSGSEKDVYKAKSPVFASVMQEIQGQPALSSVRVLGIQESAEEATKRYEPNNPLADDQGFIYQSNVNTMQEMANMISASRSYKNNVEIMNTAKQLMLATLKLGQ